MNQQLYSLADSATAECQTFTATAGQAIWHKNLSSKLSSDKFLKQDAARNGTHHNNSHRRLAVIITLGYKVNSERTIQLCKWATGIL